MDKIELLQTRRKQLLSAGKEIRDIIGGFVDGESFVEMSSFSYSKNDLYGEEAQGEGVVCGFATLNDTPVYVVAQNFAVMNGGLSKAQCDKIIKCMKAAEANGCPIIYFLNSQGVQLNEGVGVLEGFASLLVQANALVGCVPQFSIVLGDLFGQAALLPAMCDFNIAIAKKSVLTANSPFVISAKSGKNIAKELVGGFAALDKADLFSIEVASVAAAKSAVIDVLNLLPDYSEIALDCADMNTPCAKLNKTADSKTIISALFDGGKAIELGKSDLLKCAVGRVGGMACMALIFDGEEAVELDGDVMKRLNNCIFKANMTSLPIILFSNNVGVKANLEVNNSSVLTDIAEYVGQMSNHAYGKIAVVYKKAIGLGYTLFASKGIGFDYTCAFANAKIALLDSKAGAEIELNGKKADMDKLEKLYADENSDAFNAARGGFIDNIIEPQYLRQYVIASLQMLTK